MVSWTLKWSKSSKETEVRHGDTKERLHVFHGLHHLVIRNVTKEDDFLKVSCKVKDSLNDVTLTSSEAYLFVDSKFIY